LAGCHGFWDGIVSSSPQRWPTLSHQQRLRTKYDGKRPKSTKTNSFSFPQTRRTYDGAVELALRILHGLPGSNAITAGHRYCKATIQNSSSLIKLSILSARPISPSYSDGSHPETPSTRLISRSSFTTLSLCFSNSSMSQVASTYLPIRNSALSVLRYTAVLPGKAGLSIMILRIASGKGPAFAISEPSSTPPGWRATDRTPEV
jgi:hypothetical protein